MEDVRKADPTFTGFVPKTAVEAVDRYVRCRKTGLKPMLVPECLIECAKGLGKPEMDKFEDWIINPNGSLDDLDLVPCDKISAANEAIYIDNCARREVPHSPIRGLQLGPDPATLPPIPWGGYMNDEKTMMV